MDSKKSITVEVPEEARKHLARNIPTDWAGYCNKIRHRHFPGGRPPMGPNSRLFERMHRNMIEICFPGQGEDRQEVSVFAGELFDISVRYQALLLTVDATLSPIPVYEELRKLMRAMDQALRALDDEARDKIVLELGGYDAIEDIPVSKDAFDDAASLAEKVSIARRVLAVSKSQVEYMTNHFDYKQGLLGRGKPSVYAFAYAIFALAEVFEQHDHQRRSANVEQKSTGGDHSWAGNYEYSGPFLDFVREFFLKHDPSQIDNRIGSGFPSAVRKMAQKRRKAPELHHLLGDEAGPQQIVDFMIGIDQLR